MDRAEMERLIAEHITPRSPRMWRARSPSTPMTSCTTWWGSRRARSRRPDAAGFYEYLTANFSTETMTPTREHYGDDFCVLEHDSTGTVPGEFLGIPGHGKRITFRMLHVWEFRDGCISRENIWLDGGSIAAQLTRLPDAD